MKYKKILVLACSLTLLAGAIFGGCSQKTTTTTDTKTTSSSSAKTTESKTSETKDSADSLFGQITAVDGDSITLTVTQNMQGQAPSGNGQKPSGDSTEMPQGGPSKDGNSTETSGSAPDQKQKPSGDSTEKSNSNSSENSTGTTSKDGQNGPQMSGETKIITITDSTTIEKESNGSTTQATKDDLTTGTMVSITMDGDTVKMITIKEMPSGDGKGKGSSTETSETTSK